LIHQWFHVTEVYDFAAGTRKPHLNSSCADACEVKTHKIELSSGQISRLSVEQLLSLHNDDVTERFLNASEMRIRVVDTEVMDVLHAFKDNQLARKKFQSILDVNFVEKSNSIVHRIQDAIAKMDNVTYNSITRKLFYYLDDDRYQYIEFIKPSLAILDESVRDILRTSTLFNDMITHFNYYQRNVSLSNTGLFDKLNRTGHDILQKIEIHRELLEFYMSRNKHASAITEVDP
jgi:hypothetical protein